MARVEHAGPAPESQRSDVALYAGPASHPVRDEFGRRATLPPRWLRGLPIFAWAGVSFAHGVDDGQKGLGPSVLILVCLHVS